MGLVSRDTARRELAKFHQASRGVVAVEGNALLRRTLGQRGVKFAVEPHLDALDGHTATLRHWRNAVRFVGYHVAMRVHITLDHGLVAQLDERVGARRRSRFIATAVARALEDERRWDEITETLGAIEDHGHDWDDDPAAWVASQRTGDARRVG